MNRPGMAGTLVWLLLAILAAVIATRTHYTTDLSAFLPRSPTATQQLLVEQLREGPAARLIIAAIEGGSPAARAQVSMKMSQALRRQSGFAMVQNGDAAGLEHDRRFLFAHRYVLSDAVTAQRFSAAGLHEAIAASIDSLASPEGPLVKPLFPRDPTGELLNILDVAGSARAPHSAEGIWSSADGSRALLVLQTRAAGSDTDAQQRACNAVRGAFTRALQELPQDQPGVRLLLSGSPVFAVEARDLIKGEALKLSAISALLIAVLLLSVYRSVPALVLGMVPVASGALAGVAAVALGFGAVHGITLGFGVTLIGESVDYSIYLFVQRSADWRRTLWPTLRLGVLTSIAGFAALVPSSFQGLAQLGLYSIAGLTAAALVTRYVLPAWLPETLAIRDLRPAGTQVARLIQHLHRLRPVLWVVLGAAAITLYLHRGALFSHELTALSPVPTSQQDLDERLRAELGAADVRYMVVVTAPNREAVLAAAQALGQRLAPLAEASVIGGFETPTRYLPGLAVQRVRQLALPEPTALAANLARALEGLPMDGKVLEPFLADVETARTAAPLTRADLDGTSFAAAIDALLVKNGSGWSALLPVAALGSGDLDDAAVKRIRGVVAAGPEGATLLDLKGEADRLYGGYLRQAVELALAGFMVILALLLVALRSPGRIARVLAPLGLAVMSVAALLAGSGSSLGILHIVGMLLIVAVGSNYALFFDRLRADPRDGSQTLTLASLLVANLATVLAFGVLACSRVQVLADLGETVAPGALLALLFSAVLSGVPRASADAVAPGGP
ncbi:MAG TPA: MMPL family transporter [Steroidobacteraceae bacterium]|jgi:predicted exporter